MLLRKFFFLLAGYFVAAAPAAYAHVVATRYRKLVDTMGGGSDTSSFRSSKEGGAPKPPFPDLPVLKIKPEHSMFFC